jgi:hypothetical protein
MQDCRIMGIFHRNYGCSLNSQSQLNQDIELWKSNTLKKVEEDQKAERDVFVINFHDNFFNEEQYLVIYR